MHRVCEDYYCFMEDHGSRLLYISSLYKTYIVGTSVIILDVEYIV